MQLRLELSAGRGVLALGVALSGQAVTRTDERLLEGTEGLSIKACLVVESLLVFYGIPRPHGTAHRCQVLIETRTPNSPGKPKNKILFIETPPDLY